MLIRKIYTLAMGTVVVSSASALVAYWTKDNTPEKATEEKQAKAAETYEAGTKKLKDELGDSHDAGWF